MRQQFKDSFGVMSDNSDILPRWMVSQQEDGSVLGYTTCWVLCYTLPNTSKTILSSINEYMSGAKFTLNQINFDMDRLIVDRSLTSNYGIYQSDAWPTVNATFTANSNVAIVENLTGIQLGQKISFSGNSIGNTVSNNATYYVTNINTDYTAANSTIRQTAISIGAVEYSNATGTITGNVISDTLTGTSTKFNSEVMSGTVIINTSGNQIGQVLRITDDEHLVLTANSTQNITNIPFSVSGIGNAITADANGAMTVVTVPLSKSVSDNSADTYVYFADKSIIK
jgi:hypothetical protein